MIRDIHKDEAYFREDKKFYTKALERKLLNAPTVKPEYKANFYLYVFMNYDKLFRIDYSIGDDVEAIYPYYREALSYRKRIGQPGLEYDDEIDIFALGVLYSERKEEFLEDLKAIYDSLTYRDGLVDYYASYLFEGKIIPYHSSFEYQNLIEDSFESVKKAQKFWYYAHSEISWYDTHKYEDRGFYGYWSFDTAATCKIKGIYDEGLKDLKYFPYDLLVQGKTEK